MAELKPCRNCAGREWVCENHRDTPWTGLGDPDEDECCGGAGAPCPVCSPEMACTGYINRATRTLAEAGDRLAEAMEKIAGSHWERIGYDQTAIDDVPDLSAEEAMNLARQALADWRKSRGEV